MGKSNLGQSWLIKNPLFTKLLPNLAWLWLTFANLSKSVRLGFPIFGQPPVSYAYDWGRWSHPCSLKCLPLFSPHLNYIMPNVEGQFCPWAKYSSFPSSKPYSILHTMQCDGHFQPKETQNYWRSIIEGVMRNPSKIHNLWLSGYKINNIPEQDRVSNDESCQETICQVYL